MKNDEKKKTEIPRKGSPSCSSNNTIFSGFQLEIVKDMSTLGTLKSNRRDNLGFGALYGVGVFASL